MGQNSEMGEAARLAGFGINALQQALEEEYKRMAEVKGNSEKCGELLEEIQKLREGISGDDKTLDGHTGVLDQLTKELDRVEEQLDEIEFFLRQRPERCNVNHE
jgi:chromosome segregation ATPase